MGTLLYLRLLPTDNYTLNLKLATGHRGSDGALCVVQRDRNVHASAWIWYRFRR